MSLKRVVVTGGGIVSPLGCGFVNIWENILEGKCGIVSHTFSDENINVHVAGRVQGYDITKLARQKSRATNFALEAADIALQNAKFCSKTVNLDRVGVAIACGMGSIEDVVASSRDLDESYRRVNPFFVSKILPNMPSGEVSIKYKLRGPNHSSSTACAASAHAIGDAYNFIRMGYADIMLAGGTEACISPLAIAGFARMRALSANKVPLEASRPFDQTRDGFVMSEGSSILILESLECALARRAPILAEICGYGLSGDGYHITSPSPNGEGAILAMKSALKDANLESHNVDYINAHATSTPIGDDIESKAIQSLFCVKERSTKLYVSSTKGATGHMLGAAGAIEAAFCTLAVFTDCIPPTINLQNPNPVLFSHVPNFGIKQTVNIALTNSFGFGGTNASLIFRKFVNN